MVRTAFHKTGPLDDTWPQFLFNKQNMTFLCSVIFVRYLDTFLNRNVCTWKSNFKVFNPWYKIILFLFPGTSLALRLKDIDVPPHRVVGEKARLICKFDMEGDILYSVKWYKDDLEFYRFVPNDRPKLQVFPQEGIHVDVSTLLFNFSYICLF